MLFGEGPQIKNIAADLNKLFRQGSILNQSGQTVQGDSTADQGTSDLLAARDPVIQEISVGMSGEQSARYTVSGTPPLSLHNSLGKPLKAWEVDVLPKQDLHGYDSPWPAGGGKNKFNPAEATDNYWIKTDTGEPAPQNGYWITGYIPVKSGDIVRTPAKGSSRCAWVNSDKTTYTYVAYDGTVNGIVAPSDGYVILTCSKNTFPFGSDFIVTINNSDLTWSPYSNICPIYGTDKLNLFVEESYDQSATPKSVLTLPQTVYTGTIGSEGGESRSAKYVFTGNETWGYFGGENKFFYVTIPELAQPDTSTWLDVTTENGLILRINTASGQLRCYMSSNPFLTEESDMHDYAYSGIGFIYSLITPQTFPLTTPTIPTPTGTATTWATAEDGTVESMEVTYIGMA